MRWCTALNVAIAIGFAAIVSMRAMSGAAELMELTPAKFWALPALYEPIDVEALNRPLLVAAIFHETNRRRTAEGLPAFWPLDRLNQAADMQAAMMALRQHMGHENPVPRQTTVLLRVADTGLDAELVAENVAMTALLDPPSNQDVFVRVEQGRKIFSAVPDGSEVPVHTYASFARAVLEQWMNSPGHRANVLNRRLRYLGCAARPAKNVALMDALYTSQVFCTLRGR